jgi:hypothetical protein
LLFVREVGLTQTYCKTLNYIHATTRRAHILVCFQKIAPHRSNFFWWLHQPHCDELFIHSILWREEACYWRHCVFNIHSIFTWQRISSAIVGLQHRILADFVRTISWDPMSYQIQCLHLYFIAPAWRSSFRYEVDFVVSARRECSTFWKDVR